MFPTKFTFLLSLDSVELMLIKSLRRLKHPPNCHIGNCGNSAVATVARRRCGAGRAQSGWPGCGMRVD